jgi:hypothetical protein
MVCSTGGLAMAGYTMAYQAAAVANAIAGNSPMPQTHPSAMVCSPGGLIMARPWRIRPQLSLMLLQTTAPRHKHTHLQWCAPRVDWPWQREPLPHWPHSTHAPAAPTTINAAAGNGSSSSNCYSTSFHTSLCAQLQHLCLIPLTRQLHLQ